MPFALVRAWLVFLCLCLSACSRTPVDLSDAKALCGERPGSAEILLVFSDPSDGSFVPLSNLEVESINVDGSPLTVPSSALSGTCFRTSRLGLVRVRSRAKRDFFAIFDGAQIKTQTAIHSLTLQRARNPGNMATCGIDEPPEGVRLVQFNRTRKRLARDLEWDLALSSASSSLAQKSHLRTNAFGCAVVPRGKIRIDARNNALGAIALKDVTENDGVVRLEVAENLPLDAVVRCGSSEEREERVLLGSKSLLAIEVEESQPLDEVQVVEAGPKGARIPTYGRCLLISAPPAFRENRTLFFRYPNFALEISASVTNESVAVKKVVAYARPSKAQWKENLLFRLSPCVATREGLVSPRQADLPFKGLVESTLQLPQGVQVRPLAYTITLRDGSVSVGTDGSFVPKETQSLSFRLKGLALDRSHSISLSIRNPDGDFSLAPRDDCNVLSISPRLGPPNESTSPAAMPPVFESGKIIPLEDITPMSLRSYEKVSYGVGLVQKFSQNKHSSLEECLVAGKFVPVVNEKVIFETAGRHNVAVRICAPDGFATNLPSTLVLVDGTPAAFSLRLVDSHSQKPVTTFDPLHEPLVVVTDLVDDAFVEAELIGQAECEIFQWGSRQTAQAPARCVRVESAEHGRLAFRIERVPSDRSLDFVRGRVKIAGGVQEFSVLLKNRTGSFDFDLSRIVPKYVGEAGKVSSSPGGQWMISNSAGSIFTNVQHSHIEQAWQLAFSLPSHSNPAHAVAGDVNVWPRSAFQAIVTFSTLMPLKCNSGDIDGCEQIVPGIFPGTDGKCHLQSGTSLVCRKFDENFYLIEGLSASTDDHLKVWTVHRDLLNAKHVFSFAVVGSDVTLALLRNRTNNLIAKGRFASDGTFQVVSERECDGAAKVVREAGDNVAVLCGASAELFDAAGKTVARLTAPSGSTLKNLTVVDSRAIFVVEREGEVDVARWEYKEGTSRLQVLTTLKGTAGSTEHTQGAFVVTVNEGERTVCLILPIVTATASRVFRVVEDPTEGMCRGFDATPQGVVTSGSKALVSAPQFVDFAGLTSEAFQSVQVLKGRANELLVFAHGTSLMAMEPVGSSRIVASSPGDECGANFTSSSFTLSEFLNCEAVGHGADISAVAIKAMFRNPETSVRWIPEEKIVRFSDAEARCDVSASGKFVCREIEKMSGSLPDCLRKDGSFASEAVIAESATHPLSDLIFCAETDRGLLAVFQNSPSAVELVPTQVVLQGESGVQEFKLMAPGLARGIVGARKSPEVNAFRLETLNGQSILLLNEQSVAPHEKFSLSLQGVDTEGWALFEKLPDWSVSEIYAQRDQYFAKVTLHSSGGIFHFPSVFHCDVDHSLTPMVSSSTFPSCGDGAVLIFPQDNLSIDR